MKMLVIVGAVALSACATTEVWRNQSGEVIPFQAEMECQQEGAKARMNAAGFAGLVEAAQIERRCRVIKGYYPQKP